MQAIVCVNYKIIYVLGPFLCVHFLSWSILNFIRIKAILFSQQQQYLQAK
jgi:hypothetical protein